MYLLVANHIQFVRWVTVIAVIPRRWTGFPNMHVAFIRLSEQGYITKCITLSIPCSPLLWHWLAAQQSLLMMMILIQITFLTLITVNTQSCSNSWTIFALVNVLQAEDQREREVLSQITGKMIIIYVIFLYEIYFMVLTH